MRPFPPLLLGLLCLLSSIGVADVLAPYRWNQRVVILAAGSGSDATLKAQKAILAADPQGWSERNLVLVEYLGDRRQTARKDLRLKDGFQFVLVGKDGGVKFRSHQLVTLPELFRIIDAMPMRQQEMRSESQSFRAIFASSRVW